MTSIPEQIQKLTRAHDYEVRAQAHKRLVAAGTAAVDLLVAALDDPDEWKRGEVADVLGDIRDVRAVQPFTQLLADKDGPVRRHVAEALGKIGDPRAVESLVAALQRTEESDRMYIATALGRIRDTQAVKSLVSALIDKDTYVRQCAAKALGLIGDKRAFEPLLAACKEDENLRSAALEGLGNLCNPRATPLLIGILTDNKQSPASRRLAADALGSIGDQSAIGPLEQVSREAEKYVRDGAIQALSRIRGEPQNTGEDSGFKTAITPLAKEAVRILFEIALPTTPLVTEAQIRSDYERDLGRPWHGARIIRGSRDEMRQVVQRIAAGLASERTLERFTVEVYRDQDCAQINAAFPGGFIGIRAWKTDGAIHICVSDSAVLDKFHETYRTKLVKPWWKFW